MELEELYEFTKESRKVAHSKYMNTTTPNDKIYRDIRDILDIFLEGYERMPKNKQKLKLT